jgi:tetratricopeptide (TPR) repeat protein
MRALETASKSDAFAEPLIALLEYSLAGDACNAGLSLSDRYLDKCKKSRYYPEIVNLRCRLFLNCDLECKNEKELKTILQESVAPELNSSILLTLGDLAMRRKKYDDAIRYYRKLADDPDHRNAGIALPRLSRAYAQAGKRDESRAVDQLYAAEFSKVQYVTALTDKALAAREAPLREDTGKSPTHLTNGSHYAVRVGTFDKQVNAQRLQKRYSSEGYTVKVNVVDIAGRKYYVVDVGRYESKSEAQTLRAKLEAKNQERYLLVTVRDE